MSSAPTAAVITGVDFVSIATRDLDRSVAFYADVLGFRTLFGMPGKAAFLQAPGSTNDHDLGLFAIGADAGAPTAGRRRPGRHGAVAECGPHHLVPAGRRV